MSRDEGHEETFAEQHGQDEHEAYPLLSSPGESEKPDDLIVHPGPPTLLTSPPEQALRINTSYGQRQSSISQRTPDGQRRTPRTSNRVRFDLEPVRDEEDHLSTGRSGSPDDALWMDEDYELNNQNQSAMRRTSQTVPLLTNIEAPSVTVATSEDIFPEDHLENARPRSGTKMAFMNMANSIIGAGIIGQPYALRQAGMVTGILLLAALTLTVDWTIRLIVINSKLSGADSFQATMQHCFGKSGLVAISVAQWAFAFGGMIAFCIIVGDTIPHVLESMFPSLRDMSFLWLLTDRRAVIVLFVLGVSYPLSLYRDIAKVRNYPSWILEFVRADTALVGKSIGIGVSQYDSHSGDSYQPRLSCPIGVSRWH